MKILDKSGLSLYLDRDFPTNTSSDMNPKKLERQAHAAANFLKSASNPQRLLILCHLTQGEKSVGELEKRLDMRQPHLSQQLARLRHDGLVEARRDSRTIYYSLGSEEARRLIDLLYDIYCSEGARTSVRKKPMERTVREASRRKSLAPVDNVAVGV